jgi:hypothetical protein
VRPARPRGLKRPKQDGLCIAQTFLDFRKEILTKVDIDLAEHGSIFSASSSAASV